jgi:hypothetical protein
MRLFSNRSRPVHLGRFPLERLPRAPLKDAVVAKLLRLPATSQVAENNPLAKICREYCAIYERFRTGPAAQEKAPYLEDPAERAKELKSLALFFDATMVAACAVPPQAWLAERLPGHTHAVVVLVDIYDRVEADNPVRELIEGSDAAAAKLRATEVAVVVSAYIRQLGFNATAHVPFATDVSLPVMGVNAGLCRADLEAPFIGKRFAIGVVTTDLELAADQPLGPKAFFEGGAAWWLGVGGTETWWNRRAERNRPGEWGRYPMEKVKRVEESTTLIIDDEVPRMPKRSNGFYRGKKGDFGEKVAREFGRFAIKTPAGAALAELQIAQTPHQDGVVASSVDPASLDPERNRRALKTLLHHLGADIAGTCEAKRYVWVFARLRRQADRYLPRERARHRHRPGLRDDGRRLGRRLGERHAELPRLRARRPDHRHRCSLPPQPRPFGALAYQRGLRRDPDAARGACGPGRDVAHRRNGPQPLHRAALEVRGGHDQPAPCLGQADRFRPAGRVPQVLQVRA